MTTTQTTIQSNTYDLLYSDDKGATWTQYAILGREEALATIKRAAKGMVMAVVNMGDKLYS